MPRWSIFFYRSIKSSFGTGPSHPPLELNPRWERIWQDWPVSLTTSKKEMIEKLELDSISTNRKRLRELSSTHLLCKYSTWSPKVPGDSYKDTWQFGTSQKLEPRSLTLCFYCNSYLKMTLKKLYFCFSTLWWGWLQSHLNSDDFTLHMISVGRIRHNYW